MEAVRVNGGMSLRNNMWHDLRKEININELKIATFFHANFATPAVCCCFFFMLRAWPRQQQQQNNRIVDCEIKDKNSDRKLERRRVTVKQKTS